MLWKKQLVLCASSSPPPPPPILPSKKPSPGISITLPSSIASFQLQLLTMNQILHCAAKRDYVYLGLMLLELYTSEFPERYKWIVLVALVVKISFPGIVHIDWAIRYVTNWLIACFLAHCPPPLRNTCTMIIMTTWAPLLYKGVKQISTGRFKRVVVKPISNRALNWIVFTSH